MRICMCMHETYFIWYPIFIRLIDVLINLRVVNEFLVKS